MDRANTPPPSEHPTDEQITELVEGLLTDASRARVEAHVAGCAACAALAAAARWSPNAPDHAAARGARLTKGTRVGRYAILELLGAGGMGTVYAAHDPALDRRIALKLIHAQVAGPELEERLLREAKAMARLSDPDVVAVYDAGRDGAQLFIAMELVEGGTLRDWLAERPRTWREVMGVYLRAGRGLARAHASGLVHRDFKPDNVLVGRDGRARVTDFGLARDAGDDGAPGSTAEVAEDLALETTVHAPLTRPGALLGTPVYMAPEQLAGKMADARSDLYSFCVSLYEALHGERPFEGSTLAEQRAAKSAGAIRPPPSDRRVPARLRSALLAGLRAAPEARPASMDELLRALERATRWRPSPGWAGLALVGAAAVAGGIAVRASVRPYSPPRADDVVAEALAGPTARVACPIFEAHAPSDVATEVGAAAASLACARVQWELGGDAARVLPPAELLDVPRRPVDGFVAPYTSPTVRARTLDAARTRAAAYVDGTVTLDRGTWTVSVAVLAPDARPIAKSQATAATFFPAMQAAMDRLWKAPLAPRPIDADVARWTSFSDAELGKLEVDVRLLDARGATCDALVQRTSTLDAGLLGFEKTCEASFAPATLTARMPTIDESSPEALVRSAFAVAVWKGDPPVDVARRLATRLEGFLDQERSPLGHARIAYTAALLWIDANERERAEPLVLASLADDPTSEDAWELAIRPAGGGADPFAASAVADAWLPSETRFAPRAASRRGDELDARLHETQLAYLLRPELVEATRFGIALAEAGRTDDARAVAATPLADPNERRALSLGVLAFMDLHEAKMGRAIERLEGTGNQLLADLVSVAEAAGRADEVATRWAKRFLALPEDQASKTARGYDTPMVLCMRARGDLAKACLDRIERLGRGSGMNWWYEGGEPLLTGARRYAAGDVRGAVAAWRPLIAASDATMARILPTDAFERAGEPTLAARLDARKLPFTFIAGISSAAPRDAERAMTAGNPERAREIARSVIAAWEVADIDVPAVSRMRALLARIH